MDIELKHSYQKKKPIIKIQTQKMNFFLYETQQENTNEEEKRQECENRLYDFLADEFQLCTFSKVQKFEECKSSIHKKNPLHSSFQYIIDRLIPVPMGVQKESVLYRFMLLYDFTEHFPKQKNIMVLKPILPINIKENTLYLYNNVEDFFINHMKCNVQSVFMEINFTENDTYQEIYPDNIQHFQIISKQENTLKKNKMMDFLYIKYFTQENRSNQDFLSFLKMLQMGMKSLQNGGDCMIDFDMDISYLPDMQLFYWLSTCFEGVQFLKSKIYENDIQHGIFHFKHFRGLPESTPFQRISSNRQIDSLFEGMMSKRWIKYINELGEELQEKELKYREKKQFVKKELEKSSRKIEKFMNFMIEKSVKWCEKHRIPIHPIYETRPNEIIPNAIKFKFFPHEQGVDLKKIKLTYESVYSVTMPEDADKMTELIRKHYPSAKTIVDACSNVGGNTLSFSRSFQKVTSIEIDPFTYQCLVHNVQLYKRKNVQVTLGDYVQLKANLHPDVVFFDPPWGGIYYKIEKDMDLFLSNENLIDLLPPNFALKAPINYNIAGLLQKFPNVVIYYFVNKFIFILPISA